MASAEVVDLWELAEDFDDDVSKSILDTRIDKIVRPLEAVEKSLYNFDLETPEGIDRLLELLPIMDPEIINEVYQEIFPMYPVDTLAPRFTRIELRGYLLDYLYGEFERPVEEADPAGLPGLEPGAAEGLGEEAVAEEPAPDADDEAATPEEGTISE